MCLLKHLFSFFLSERGNRDRTRRNNAMQLGMGLLEMVDGAMGDRAIWNGAIGKFILYRDCMSFYLGVNKSHT